MLSTFIYVEEGGQQLININSMGAHLKVIQESEEEQEESQETPRTVTKSNAFRPRTVLSGSPMAQINPFRLLDQYISGATMQLLYCCTCWTRVIPEDDLETDGQE